MQMPALWVMELPLAGAGGMASGLGEEGIQPCDWLARDLSSVNSVG